LLFFAVRAAYDGLFPQRENRNKKETKEIAIDIDEPFLTAV